MYLLDRDEVRHVWCSHCERVALQATWRELDECPYCGVSPLDAQPWEPGEWPRDAHEDYTEEPVLGGYYPLCEPQGGQVVGAIPTK